MFKDSHNPSSMFTRISPPICDALSASIHGNNISSADSGAVGVLEIETRPGGCNSGRRYQMRSSSTEELDEWAAEIRRAWGDVLRIRDAALQVSPLLLWFRGLRAGVAAVYESAAYKSALVLVLVANFLLLMVIAQIQPEPNTAVSAAMDRVEYTFTAVFTAELLMNLFVNWLRPFLADK